MLIIGGMVFAVFLDGGARLLGRVLPIGRGWRLAIVILLGFGFVGWVFWFAGTTIAAQAEALRAVVDAQFTRLDGLRRVARPDAGRRRGVSIGQQLLGSVGRLTSAVGSALGAVRQHAPDASSSASSSPSSRGSTTAASPGCCRSGTATSFYAIADRVGFTLRRLLFGRLVGMVFEGVVHLDHAAVGFGGVPMAALLGLITGLLAFLPNIGAHHSGVLMVAVGFSAGTDRGSGRSSSISSSRTSMAIWSSPISPAGRSTSRRRWCWRCNC